MIKLVLLVEKIKTEPNEKVPNYSSAMQGMCNAPRLPMGEQPSRFALPLRGRALASAAKTRPARQETPTLLQHAWPHARTMSV